MRTFSSRTVVGFVAPTGHSRLKREVVWSLILAAVTLVVFWPVSGFEFVSLDDQVYVTENQRVISGPGAAGIAWAFRNLEAGFWHPLTWLSHMIDCQLFGLRPGWHHLTNLFIHIASTIVLFFLFSRSTGRIGRSVVIAALFALHPLHVESVAWVAERKDLLAGFFFLATICAYATYARRLPAAAPDTWGAQVPESERRYNRQPTPDGGLASRRGPGGYYFLSVVLFICGLMSKPTVVMLPFVLLLLDYWPLRRFKFIAPRSRLPVFRRLLLEKLPFLAVACVIGLITIQAERGVGALPSVSQFPITTRLGNAVICAARYLFETFVPFNLAVFYPYPAKIPILTASISAGFLVLATIVALRAARKTAFISVGWFWYLLTLLPMSGLIQVGTFSHADRATYLPLIGIFLVLAWAGEGVLRRFRASKVQATTIGIVLLAVLSARTRDQLGYWQNSEGLYRRAIAVTRNNSLAETGLAVILERSGRLEEAAVHYQTAVAAQPELAGAHNNLANIFARLGQGQQALSYGREAMRLRPDWAEAHYNTGNALFLLKRYAEAEAEYSEALRLKSSFIEASQNLALTLEKMEKLPEAVSQYTELVRLRPDYPPAYQRLASVLARQGKLEQAIETASEGLRQASLSGDVELGGRIREDLSRYKSTRPDSDKRPGP